MNQPCSDGGKNCSELLREGRISRENERKAKEAEDIEKQYKDFVKDAISYNKLVLTLGYGALFAAMTWLHGKTVDNLFYIAAVALFISLATFFTFIVSESYVLSSLTLVSPEEFQRRREEELHKTASLWRKAFLLSMSSAIIASIFVAWMIGSVLLSGARSDMITVLEREVSSLTTEKAALEAQLDTALRILHHERLMHFGIASRDVERIMREKATSDKGILNKHF
jgi:hypothetical protein